MENKSTKISLIVFVSMVFVAYIWCTYFYDIYTNKAKIFFIENRLYDIIHMIPISLKEELIWRFIPFVLLSIVVILLRDTYKDHKEIIHFSCSQIIVAIQILFGYAHYLPLFEEPVWVTRHIVIQGFSGLCFAIIYNVVLYTNLSDGKNVGQLNFNSCNILMSHFLAFIASSAAHILLNTLIIINKSF